jgi:hypothetical protein
MVILNLRAIAKYANKLTNMNYFTYKQSRYNIL